MKFNQLLPAININYGSNFRNNSWICCIWFNLVFSVKTKNSQISTEELRNKEEELKKSQIDLARREEEIKAAVEAKQNLTNQLEEKKGEVKDLYEKVDEITKGVTEYKSISEKAINKHDEAIARHTNWWEKLTTNITYQGKFNQEILENLLTSANLVKDRDFFLKKNRQLMTLMTIKIRM